MNYTVIGDNVNVAARLYNVAKGGEIIISETTYEECKEIVEVDELEPVSVKGKVKPIKIYNVKGLKEDAIVADVGSEILATRGCESSGAKSHYAWIRHLI